MRLLLIEDNRRLADLLADYLDKSGYRVDRAESLAMAHDFCAIAYYDVIVLDLGLPDGDGFSFLADLRRSGDSVPILILTARDGIDSRIKGLDLGADDYLLKPFHNDELAARLRALLRRPENFLGHSLRCGNLSLNANERKVEISEQPLSLSRREVDVLEIMLRRGGHIVTKQALMEAMHETGDALSDNALEVSIHRLRKKLQAGGSTCEVKTVRGIGYMADGPNP